MSDNLPDHAYTSTAVREDRYWLVRCDQTPSIRSKVRLLTQAADHQRRALAEAIGVPAAWVAVDVRPVLPKHIHERIARAHELRATATWANSSAAAEVRAAARILADAQFSLRDIGTILGVSYQRAHQLTRL
ncbi:hypothetical protein [Phytoactinopolyspora halotolerans]|uniref:Uncharacterized protein n=1 Tax=Phytoactinopolyspora halotolerans TaxID=1981512 RepID=A0A6L9SH23_9ACTN|nr:hypothetical protein [Phytoactinopolyspora halotolerans]NEE03712.1 hypothetical protein [Phytoactinopolyspora halotolerans]